MLILGDENKNFRPTKYERVYEGCKLTFEYKLIKLIDYKENDLIKSRNVFAMITLTHLKAIEAGNNTELKKIFKLSLVKMLRQKGFSQKDIKNLHKFIDWLIRLPNDMEKHILEQTKLYEEVIKMPLVLTAEKLGIEKGIKKERIELAKRMLFYNEPIDKIAKYTGLKTNQIKRLKPELE